MLDIYVTMSFYRVTHLDVWLYRKIFSTRNVNAVFSCAQLDWDFQHDEPTLLGFFFVSIFFLPWKIFRHHDILIFLFFFAASNWYLMINLLLFLQSKIIIVWWEKMKSMVAKSCLFERILDWISLYVHLWSFFHNLKKYANQLFESKPITATYIQLYWW